MTLTRRLDWYKAIVPTGPKSEDSNNMPLAMEEDHLNDILDNNVEAFVDGPAGISDDESPERRKYRLWK